jgi:recombination protein RecT
VSSSDLVARDETRHASLAVHIRSVKPYLEELLPGRARAFAMTMMAAARHAPEIFDCTPASVVGSALVCAQLDLEPGPADHLYLIPRRNGQVPGRPLELTVLLGYKGMKALAERHPDIAYVETGEVCRGDVFEHIAQPASIHHEPAWGAVRGDPYLWYAIAYRRDGLPPHIAVIDQAEVERRRSFSQAKDRGPWVTNYSAMARKSAVRALWPGLPSSLDLVRAAEVDDAPGAITTGDLVPALAAGGRSVDPDTGEVLGEPEPDVGAPAEGEAAGVPATELQMIRIAHLQGAHGLDDHDLCELVRDRFGLEADTVEDALTGLTDEQAGELIVALQPDDDEKT